MNKNLFPLDYLKSLTPETKRAYLQDIKEFFGVEDMNDITIDMVRSVTFEHINLFRRMLEKKGREPATINRKISAVSSFYDYCKGLKFMCLFDNPCKSKLVKRMKVNDKSSTNWMRMEDIKNILDKIDHQRNHLICKMFAFTGLRNSELRNIKMSDFIIIDGEWYLKVLGKGNKLREVWIEYEFKKEIDKYIGDSKREYLFIGESRNGLNGKQMDRKAIGDVVKKYFPKGITPHSLRQNFIREAIKSGNSLYEIQRMLGFDNLGSLGRYFDVDKDEYLKFNPGKLIKL